MDVIDSVIGAVPGDRLYDLRRTRPDVVSSVQVAYDTFFSPEQISPVSGIGLEDRLALALTVATASGALSLVNHYVQALDNPQRSADVCQGVLSDDSEKFTTMYGFATKLSQDPGSIVAGDLEELSQAGLSSGDVVTIAQLIGFVAFQVRVVAGLRLMGD